MTVGVGIANLPNQLHRKTAKKGGKLTIMIVGEAGLGKTTFLNTLFTSVVCKRDEVSEVDLNESTSRIKVTYAELTERGFKLRLTVVDTPGFGDYINNTDTWQPIVEYIESQNQNYLNQEMRADRSNIQDGRVHVCIYFIEPTGHTLKPLDVKCMKELGARVNLVPVIAKADTITPQEMQGFKKRILEEIEKNEISVYRCPMETEDEESAKRNQDIMDAMPFSVIGSEAHVTGANGKKVLGREYPWGVAEVENDDHCDFKRLRSLLLRTHLLDIISTTEDIHYEAFRDTQMAKGGLKEGITPEKLKKELEQKCKSREEEMRKKFTEQVKQEESRFHAWEEGLSKQADEQNAYLDKKRQENKELKEEVESLQTALEAAKKAADVAAPPKKKGRD
eukprot:Lithocolla_globosa_v1_NODE_5163_length_1290_cov_80.735223.p1 type:complete len:393 gc:universal NODE_5163_length_1290_cov_80.735223:77-1255(+)